MLQLGTELQFSIGGPFPPPPPEILKNQQLYICNRLELEFMAQEKIKPAPPSPNSWPLIKKKKKKTPK